MACSVAFVALVLLLSYGDLPAQEVQGVVLDAFSHAPVKSADVALLGTKGRVVGRKLTGPDGRFEITLREFGVYAIQVHALGYTPFVTHLFVADTSQEVSAQVNLAPAPLALKGLDVTTTALRQELEQVGFYRRKKAGFGYYLTPKQIVERTAGGITDAFYGIPGVTVRRNPKWGNALWDITVHGANRSLIGSGLCYPSIYLDGDMIRHGGADADPGQWTLLVTPRDVAAIEVYPNPGGLPAFASGSDSPCGTVLIWTKSH